MGVLRQPWFRVLRAYTIGLVCGVAFLHVLADSQECLEQVSSFPVANSVMLAGVFMMVVVNELAIEKETARPMLPGGCTSLSGHSHAHLQPLLDAQLAPDSHSRLKAYAMEASISVHSLLVGIGLGVVTKSVASVFTLACVLVMHQFFEGIALGIAGTQANLSRRTLWILTSVFSLTCPFGGLLGIQLAACRERYEPGATWSLGIANALAAGALVHIGFVHMLNEDFGEHAASSSGKDACIDSENHECTRMRLLALCSGGATMTLLAAWV